MPVIFRQVVFFIFLLVTSFVLEGCRQNSVRPNESGAQSARQKEKAAMREITDDLGRKISIPQQIERAVSLAPNLTENVFAVGAGDKLVGVTTYCNYPQDALKIAKVGDTINPNLETIIALKPQIVLVSTASQIQSFLEKLDAQQIAVFVSNPQDLDGVYRSLNQLGEIFNRAENAETLVASMKNRVADVERQTANLPEGDTKVFVQISREPLFTIGKSSFISDLINRAGGASVTANLAEAYPKLSKETALASEPEAIILSDSEDNPAPNDVFKKSPAVKNNKIFKIDADLLSRPSPRAVEGLEQIARALHPSAFSN